MPRLAQKLTILALTSAPLLSGCSSGLLERRLAEGVIEYALSFPDYDPNGIMAGMLPEKTTLLFSDDKQIAELSAGMGVFRTTMVIDGIDQVLDYHLSLMSKKMVAHLQPGDLSLFNQDSGKPTILFTSDRDTIAGFPCKRAIAIFDRIDHPETDLWYTDRIALEHPNWFSPFAEVPGVLLRYDIVQYGMRMRLNAISVQPGEVDPSRFMVKKDFESVKPEVLHHELSEVLATFSM
ncbi:MAG: hypothetical protein E6Q44_08575 [Flavobacteriales bacterium]|jgi:hypothetical protein|nr:MAG: hypothetical protein E6Q44_08575 [Flavobacteriales bacterium]